MKRIAITGLGAVTPIGNDAPSTWEAAVAGRSGIDFIAAFDPSDLPVKIAAEVKQFDPSPIASHKELRKLEPMREMGYDLPDDIITGDDLHDLEPSLSRAVTAGFLIREHWHVKSDTFTTGLAAVLRRDGVETLEGAEVLELVRVHSGHSLEP